MDLADKLRAHFAIRETNQESPIQPQDSIRKQLERLRSIQEKERSEPARPWPEMGLDDFDGEVRSNAAGSFQFFYRRVTCPGLEGLSFSRSSAGVVSLMELLQGKRLDLVPNQILYLDTETTGLSGGTGTYAFLAGIGYWEEQGASSNSDNSPHST